MIIRDAEEADIPFIVGEGIKFLEHHPMNLQEGVDKEYLLSLATLLIKEHIVLIAEEGDSKMGMIAGLVTPHIYNPKHLGVQELFWWVLPEYRTSKAGLKLFKVFEERAIELNASFIAMVSTIYTPTLDKVYKRYNYRPVESSYFKEL